jgi:hypothetical protein
MNEEIHAALVAQIVALQARVDGLTSLVEILALQAGSDREKFRKALKTVTDSAHQTRLARLEDQSPRAAAMVDRREDIAGLDLDLTGMLGFEDE